MARVKIPVISRSTSFPAAPLKTRLLLAERLLMALKVSAVPPRSSVPVRFAVAAKTRFSRQRVTIASGQ